MNDDTKTKRFITTDTVKLYVDDVFIGRHMWTLVKMYREHFW